jgi:hypothetical protein
MRPKEKAEQLIRKYYSFGINKEGQTLSWDESKQCALIAVYEILNINSVDKDYDLSNYWEEVKQEIKNLLKNKDMKTEEKVLVLKKAEDFQKDTVFFSMDKNRNEILKLCPNGDIFVKGRLAENDKQVVEALKEWLNSQGFSI